MIPRSAFQFLVGALALLIVTFTVLVGGYALAQASGDATAARVLWWIAMGALSLVVIDLILLVAALGIAMIDRPPPPPPGRREPRDQPTEPDSEQR